MIQSIIDGIIKAIRTEYDRSFRIYTESVEQGLKEPCFSILCLNGSDKQNVGTRRNREHLFNITYFPSTDTPISECSTVMENLYDLLSTIEVDTSMLHGMNMNGQIVDGVLQFQVTYAFFLLSVNNKDGMENIEVTTNGKE